MPSIIDADTHVDECESTWQSLEAAASRYIPTTITPDAGSSIPEGMDPQRSRWWLVEGRLSARAVRDEIHHPVRARRELDDIEGRLRDMDGMDVDVQVIFPTFFIRYGNSNLETEANLTWAYNRWLAERCALSDGRLRWTVVLPLSDVDAAVSELRWAKENGACGIFKRGFDLNKPSDDPCFFPIYEEAASLNLPVCIHTGHPLPGQEWDRGYPVMSAFMSIVSSGLPTQFPDLRFGFIEAGASWVPYAISQLQARQRSDRLHERAEAFRMHKDLFREDRLFVAIDPVDQIEHLLDFGMEDNLMIGTDYCHSDQSAHLAALKEVENWVSEGRISSDIATKILETNARHFYDL